MAVLETKAHDKLVAALSDIRCSPAVMARYMKNESTYVNESVLQYLINYIVIMASLETVPFNLKEIKSTCDLLYCSLQELGLTGTVGRMPVDTTDYLAV